MWLSVICFCRNFCLLVAFLFISHQEYLHHLSYLGCATGACLQCKCGDMDPRYIWQSRRHSECYEKTWWYLTSLSWLFMYRLLYELCRHTSESWKAFANTRWSSKCVSVFESPPLNGAIICKGCCPCVRCAYAFIPKDWCNVANAEAKSPARVTCLKTPASKSLHWCPEFLVHITIKKLKSQRLSQPFHECF